MTISKSNLYLVSDATQAMKRQSLNGVEMCELGNQTLCRGVNNTPKDKPRTSAKPFFNAVGVKHTSLDLNAKDGAIAVNLSKSIEKWDNFEKFINRFDMVTNFGTSEHCSNQKTVFENIHKLTRVGGAMVHSVPPNGYWKGHCRFKYTPLFFKSLAEKCGYNLIKVEFKKRGKEQLLNALLIKTEDPFRWTDRGIKVIKSFRENEDNAAEKWYD